MKNMYKNLIPLGVLAGFALGLSAATVDGFLMDKMCSNAKKDGKTHTTECALSPNCQKSGFVVVTKDGKALALDAKGNAEALKALKATKKTDNLMVTVDGDVSADSIKVTSLKLQ
jgi:hypothetical protein